MSKRGYSAPKAPAKPQKPATIFKTVPFWQLLAPSWQLFKISAVPVLVVSLLPLLLIILGSSLVNGFKHVTAWTAVGMLVEFTGLALTALSASAGSYLQLTVSQGRIPGIIDLYRQSIRFLPRLIGLAALLGLIIIFGLICLVVPGIKAIRRYILAPYYLIDRDCGIRQAMHSSAANSKAYARPIWGMVLCLLVFATIIGLLQHFAGTAGTLLASIMPAGYYYIPVLRYQEVAHQRSITAVKSQLGITKS